LIAILVIDSSMEQGGRHHQARAAARGESRRIAGLSF